MSGFLTSSRHTYREFNYGLLVSICFCTVLLSNIAPTAPPIPPAIVKGRKPESSIISWGNRPGVVNITSIREPITAPRTNPSKGAHCHCVIFKIAAILPLIAPIITPSIPPMITPITVVNVISTIAPNAKPSDIMGSIPTNIPHIIPPNAPPTPPVIPPQKRPSFSVSLSFIKNTFSGYFSSVLTFN